MLALTFYDKFDYEKIQENDTFNFQNLNEFSENNPLILEIKHEDGSVDIIKCNHTYNNSQIQWFKAGSALNLIRSQS